MKDIYRYDVSEYELREAISELLKENKELKEKNALLNQCKQDLDKVHNSALWKVSKPIRGLKRRIRKEKTSSNEMNYKDLKCYNSHYEKDKDFSNKKTDIKTLAFYLPQYHEFKENNEWWGKGFTEWTNTKKSKPRFEGHYQPREPHPDFGYYKLDNIETIKKQVELAKRHGIYGFCFYYYWFSGKRLMETPGDLFLKHKEIDFPFCLCWANENWTRAWDGLDKDILIQQDYSKEDRKNFIKDMEKYLIDERYIKVDGKPLVMVYNPDAIPNFKETINEWRKTAKDIGIGELCIWSKATYMDSEHKYTEYVDGEFDFPPHGVGHDATKIPGLPSPKIYNYEKIVNDIEHLYREHFPIKDFYYTCTMGWDNSARREEGFTVYFNYSLESYYKWLRYIIEETRKRHPKDKRFILINAWNEWAEGTYLEPDKKYGYANINTLSKAIFDIPLDENKKEK